MDIGAIAQSSNEKRPVLAIEFQAWLRVNFGVMPKNVADPKQKDLRFQDYRHVSLERRQLLRLLLMAPLLSTFAATTAEASPINPSETFELEPDQIQFKPWQGLPASSGEMATLYGDLNKPGPYLVMMKWTPGWFSAPHNYRTDRICVVVSGTWWVNSGADFTPQQTVPVRAGGYVLRHARTWHYDGVPADSKEPAMIAVFGIGPVDIRLADPAKPSWRQV
jgi:hypothetical protein